MSSSEGSESERSAWLSDTALSALGLREQPFASRPSDGDAFTDELVAERLADIRQALLTGDDLLLILGERGVGKSTLLAQLAVNSGLRIQCFSVVGSARFSTRNLFVGMLEAFKVEPPEELEATLDELIPCLQAMLASNKLCVVVLDDAQALAERELTTLLSGMLYINSRDESLLRIAIAAPPEFEERLPDLLPEGADLPYSSLSLEPFDTARAAAYLDFRLSRAGRSDALPFDADELAALNARADGRPGALHVAAAAALENAHGEPGAAAALAKLAAADVAPTHDDLPPELHDGRAGADRHAAGRRNAGWFDGRTPKLALGAFAGLLIIGGLLLFRPTPGPGETDERYRVVEQRKIETERETEQSRLLREEESRRAEDAGERVAVAVTDDGVPGKGASDGDTSNGDAPEETVPRAEASSDPAATPEPAPTPEPDSTAEPESTPEPDSEPDPAPASVPEIGSAVTSEAEPPPAPAPRSAPTPETEASEPESGAESEVGSGVVTEPAPSPEPESPEPESPEPEAPAPPPDGGPRTDIALLGTDETSAPVAPLPEETFGGALESPNWVLVQDPAQFTVQMIASVERASVEEFLVRHELAAPNSIFAFDRDGTTWYALVHGLFASLAEARTTIERMPTAAQRHQPWIRSVRRLQQTLKEQ